jgi:hypothetical protein
MIHNSPELHRLALQWVDRCATLLSAQDWERVRQALGDMHDQLREDVPDEAEFDELFGDLVAGLIDRLGSHQVQSLPQAQIYLFSADEAHRISAATWLEANRH